jgi:phytoene dehydrogenase-like protein
MDVLYGIENPLFLEKELQDPKYLAKTLFPWLVRYSVNIRKVGRLKEPVQQYLKKFTANEALIDLICQHFFAETPTFFALSYFGLYLDYRYPVGGTGALPARLTEYLLSHGGELKTNAAVTKILPSRHEAILSDGSSVRYRQLVWAADQTAFYRTLGEALPEKIEKKREVSRAKPRDRLRAFALCRRAYPAGRSGGRLRRARVLYAADNRAVVPAELALVALRRHGGHRGWIVSYFETTTYEISIPALRDPSLARPGKTGWIISTLFDYDLTAFFAENDAYEALKTLASETILRVLAESAIPALAGNVEFSICSTPLTIERETGARHGAITGWAHTNRPIPAVHEFGRIQKSIETGLTDILQCGMWTFSPAGLPVSILTGKLAADEAARRLRKRGGRV